MSTTETNIKTTTAVPLKAVVQQAPEQASKTESTDGPHPDEFEEEDDEDAGGDTAVTVDSNEFMDDADDEDDEDDDHATIEIFSEDCLRCKSLVPAATKLFKKCHFSRGNEHCPAQSVQIVTRIPLEKILLKFRSAEKTRDTGKLAELYATLAKKPSWYQERVNKALEEARKADE